MTASGAIVDLAQYFVARLSYRRANISPNGRGNEMVAPVFDLERDVTACCRTIVAVDPDRSGDLLVLAQPSVEFLEVSLDAIDLSLLQGPAG
jgi:hypothetical protein